MLDGLSSVYRDAMRRANLVELAVPNQDPSKSIPNDVSRQQPTGKPASCQSGEHIEIERGMV